MWESFGLEILNVNGIFDPTVREQYRRAFYCGAFAAFSVLNEIETPEGTERVFLELREFMNEMKPTTEEVN